VPDGPSDVERLVREGIVAAAAGGHSRAREVLARAVSQDEASVPAWLWLSGEVETSRGDPASGAISFLNC